MAMIWTLRIFFLVVLASMLWVTSWASLQCAVWKVPREVATYPWFIATLFDAYWGFLTFYCWVCWKEISWARRIVWFIAILLLGNIAMAIYMLNKLFRLKGDEGVRALVVNRS